MKLLHDKVKATSSKAHKALDSNSLMKKIMSPTVNISDYHFFLEAFFPIYNTLESDIYQLGNQIIPNIINNQRLHELKNDLNQFNSKVNNCTLSEAITYDKDNILGAIYVFEGSRHGAYHIAKHLKNKLNLEDNKLQFLLHSPTVKWNEIINTLNNVKESNHNAIIEGVNTTFNLFLNHFNCFEEKLIKYEGYRIQ